MKAAPITFKGFEPYYTPKTPDGVRWLYAKYETGDEVWRTWPKYVEYGGELYKWSCFNSDELYVVYKQASAIDLAVPVVIN